MVTDQSKQKKPAIRETAPGSGDTKSRKSLPNHHSQSNSPADMNSAVYENQSKNNATTTVLFPTSARGRDYLSKTPQYVPTRFN
jgi:hypothetical protein